MINNSLRAMGIRKRLVELHQCIDCQVKLATGNLLERLRGIDPLNRRFPTGGRSNWIERDAAPDPALYAKQYSGPHGRPAS